MTQQMRTTRLTPPPTGQPADAGGVTIIAPGRGLQVAPGRTVRETLAAAGIETQAGQLIRVGREEVLDRERILQTGDVVTVVHKVRAGLVCAQNSRLQPPERASAVVRAQARAYLTDAGL